MNLMLRPFEVQTEEATYAIARRNRKGKLEIAAGLRPSQ
jgi:hypothetical protein